jgi:hypothetical protein
MSYSLANLEDGSHPNTRHELLDRVLVFFDMVTGIDDEIFITKNNINLYPNPAKNNITLSFELETESQLSVEVYNLTGQLLLSVAERRYPEGINKISIGVDGLHSGAYIYRLLSATETYSGKLLISK